MLTLKQFAGSTINPADDATLYDSLLNHQIGVFEGVKVSVQGTNQLRIESGRGVIKGRVFEVEEESVNAKTASSGTVPGRLLVRIDLDNIENPITFDTQAESPLPELVQENINGSGKIFEMELAAYSVNETSVLGLRQTFNTIETGWFGEPNATATHTDGYVDITANDGVTSVTFYAPSDFDRSDKYRLNGEALNVTDLNGRPLDYAWKTGAPVTFYIKGNQAFFRSGGSGVNDTLPQNPVISGRRQSGNIAMSITKVTDAQASALDGALLVYGSHEPKDIYDGQTKEISRSNLVTSSPGSKYEFTITFDKNTVFYARIFAYNSRRQYQTMEENSIIMVTPIDFKLPSFTGDYQIFGDESEGRIELKSSGTLTLDKGTYDFFLVGPGASGANCAVRAGRGGSGGGGGYTKTVKGQVVSSEETWTVEIGAGGVAPNWDSTADGNRGGTTRISHGGTSYEAQSGVGGTNQSKSGASDGGSGGGAGTTTGDPGRGGSDGNDGEPGVRGYSAGKGQGTTTRAFEDPEGQLLAGGGAGGGGYGANTENAGGGEGGGGGAAYDGTPNTGGGGGGGESPWYDDDQSYGEPAGNGGSGIVIVRWKNVA